jgi:hypothetical protein
LTCVRGHQAPTRRDWSRLSATWTSRIDDRIAELERLRRGLTERIGCGCLSLDRCRLANPAIVPGVSVLARVIGSVIGRWADWPA